MLLLFTTVGIITNYVEKAKAEYRWYEQGKFNEMSTKYITDDVTGTKAGNKAECYKCLDYDQYMYNLKGTVSLDDDFWVYDKIRAIDTKIR